MSTVPIVALDFPDQQTALAMVDELGDACRFYKVGAELFTAVGPQVLREVRARGADVFLDLKYHDIPNTVSGAVRSAARCGVRLVTVHASGGAAMLTAAANAAAEAEACSVFAVTVLTSLDAAEIAAAWGRGTLDIADEVSRLALMARDSGVDGIVCSGREAGAVKAQLGAEFGVLIPGVRFAGGAVHDQSRTVTPRQAAATGADYVVVGRAVSGAADRRGAMREVCAQLR